jgi:two-component system response regulator AtoC
MCDDPVILPEHITLNTAAKVTDLISGGKTLREYSNFIIQHYLDNNKGDVLLVAKLLDIGKSTIYRMIQSKELVVD